MLYKDFVEGVDFISTLSYFQPKFELCKNQVVGFYFQDIWKTPVEEWHFK